MIYRSSADPDRLKAFNAFMRSPALEMEVANVYTSVISEKYKSVLHIVAHQTVGPIFASNHHKQGFSFFIKIS